MLQCVLPTPDTQKKCIFVVVMTSFVSDVNRVDFVIFLRALRHLPAWHCCFLLIGILNYLLYFPALTAFSLASCHQHSV